MQIVIRLGDIDHGFSWFSFRTNRYGRKWDFVNWQACVDHFYGEIFIVSTDVKEEIWHDWKWCQNRDKPEESVNDAREKSHLILSIIHALPLKFSTACQIF